MNTSDYIIIAIVSAIIVASAIYIIIAKRRGRKCIGCPSECSGSCERCTHSCISHTETEDDK